MRTLPCSTTHLPHWPEKFIRKFIFNVFLFQVSLWFIGIWTETLGHRDYIRPYSYSIPSENSKSVGQNGIGVSYGKLSSYMYRDSGDYGQEIEVT